MSLNRRGFPLWRRRDRRPDDRGAVAMMVAILLAGGVLLGFMAIVVDVGKLYVEREELQSGADAGALAAAKACSTRREPECSSFDDLKNLVVQGYADANASDGRSQVVEVCGRLYAGDDSTCGAQPSNLTACLGDEDALLDDNTRTYVEVRLATEMADGQFVLPPTFAQAMAGNGDYEGSTVGACARAEFTPAESLPVLGIAMSDTEYDDFTNRGRDFAEAPFAWSDQKWLQFCRFGGGECNDPWNWGVGGAAAYLSADSACEVTLPGDGQNVSGRYLYRVRSNPNSGNPPPSTLPSACVSRLRDAQLAGTVLYIPVYNGVTDFRSTNPVRYTAQYDIAYLAEVVVTGYSFKTWPNQTDSRPSISQPRPPNLPPSRPWNPPPSQCDTSEACISLVVVGRVELFQLTGDAIVKLVG